MQSQITSHLAQPLKPADGSSRRNNRGDALKARAIGGADLTGRQLSAFWPSYFMLAYTVGGLWFGAAFVVIGLGITALTFAGYFLVGPWFDLWMAFVNGGGLIVADAWMRRS